MNSGVNFQPQTPKGKLIKFDELIQSYHEELENLDPKEKLELKIERSREIREVTLPVELVEFDLE